MPPPFPLTWPHVIVVGSVVIRVRPDEYRAFVAELADGGLGRRALGAHTKNSDNRRQFFELYRRMARQVTRATANMQYELYHGRIC